MGKVFIDSWSNGCYKYKLWCFEFSEMFGPALIDEKTHEIIEECMPKEHMFWKYFYEWFNLSKEEKNQYKINTTEDYQTYKWEIGKLNTRVNVNNQLLHDAIGLLHNHEQSSSEGWKEDYEDVCKRYDELIE